MCLGTYSHITHKNPNSENGEQPLILQKFLSQMICGLVYDRISNLGI